MEYWSTGIMEKIKNNTNPPLHHSITPTLQYLYYYDLLSALSTGSTGYSALHFMQRLNTPLRFVSL